MVGVTVMVVGTKQGVVTDAKGTFSLTLPNPNSEIRVTYVGYVQQQIPVNGQIKIDIKLAPDVKSLGEVVVVGYGTQKKESVVGAITMVNNAALLKAGTQNVTNAITGKLSGVLTIQDTGEPGADNTEVLIRGVSSWNGSAPLTLVDGVERDYSSLDPNEISSISVLKDASATAVFGAKGANGVIIVTTKRGELGKPQMSFTGSFGFDRATRIPPFIDSYTTMSLLNVARMNGQQFDQLSSQAVLNQYQNPTSPLMALQYPNVDWFKLLTNPFAPTANANFNISGGTDFVKYFSSFGWYYMGDFFKSYHSGYDDTRYKYNRFNYRANVDFNLTKTTKLSVNVGGEVGVKNQQANSPWRDMYSTSPARYPAYFPAWVLQQVPDPDYPDASGTRQAASFGEYTGNPYNTLNSGSFNQYLDSKLFTDLIFDQKLDAILPGLSFNAKASMSTYYQTQSLTASYSFPQYTLDYSKIGVPGVNPWIRNGQANEVYNQGILDINVGGLQGNYYKNIAYEGSLNYNNTFGKHSLTAMALMKREEKDQGTDFPYYNEALVGRVTYDYARKYLFEVNAGYTGSERFSPKNRFGFFPSGAIGYVLSEEPFMKSAAPWISKLKFRYSDGLVGSDYAANRWLYVSQYYVNGSYIREDLGANVNAQWEEARKKDLGLELGVFKNMVTLGVDLFDEHRDKMLLTPRSVTMLVGNSFKDLNLGSMKKHGIEVELEFNKTTRSQLNYHFKGIFGFNENRVIYKDDPVYAPDYTKNAGKPVDAQLTGALLTGTGYYTTINDIHNNPSPISVEKLNVGDYKFLDYTADGMINSTDEYPIAGSLYPPITYSFSGGFSYKGFEFSFMFAGDAGKYVEYNQTYEAEFVKGDYRVHSSQLDYWTPANQDANHSTLHYSGSNSADILFWGGGEADKGYQIMLENRFWRKADFLRLKEVFASYTFNSTLLKRVVGINNMSVYATGTNLWTLTNLIEGDPERKDFEQGFYPQMSSFNIGLKFGF
ncbi:MAG: SusC/RagA family TonB-linked outer membrane protein [Bacteroidota bacterium]|nr:SusC/RagA family TonB-linked outer membrane protein [Bacteroidota bacterium]